MKQGGQKQKSNAHEREVAKLFTAAYYPEGDGEFRRVPLSGGWDKRVAPGDLIALKYRGDDMEIDKSFPFLIECKNWRKVNVNFIFAGLYTSESVIYDWLEQVIGDAESASQIPIVVFKIWRDNCVLMRGEEFSRLMLLFGVFNGKFYYAQRRKLRELEYNLFFCRLDDFIEWIDWEVYKFSDHTKYLRSMMKKEEKNNED